MPSGLFAKINHFGVSLKCGTPISHPKMIIFSRKTHGCWVTKSPVILALKDNCFEQWIFHPKRPGNFSGWWFQLSTHWENMSQKWIISPGWCEIKEAFETTTYMIITKNKMTEPSGVYNTLTKTHDNNGEFETPWATKKTNSYFPLLYWLGSLQWFINVYYNP